MAESVGLPFGTYVVVTDLVSPDAGLLAGTAVVWLLIATRKIVTGSVTSLLMISALVLTVQTAVAISTGYLWMFQLQFPLANLAMCLVFARTAPTRKPLVAQLAPRRSWRSSSRRPPPGLHRFFQGATWFWAGLFLVLTLGMAVMMVTEPFKLFMLLSTVVTIAPDRGRRRRVRAVVLRRHPPPRPAAALHRRLADRGSRPGIAKTYHPKLFVA